MFEQVLFSFFLRLVAYMLCVVGVFVRVSHPRRIQRQNYYFDQMNRAKLPVF